ncbi:MAG: hypothetical protein ACR2NB_10115 [Solirubrobacteraceae bacterium]
MRSASLRLGVVVLVPLAAGCGGSKMPTKAPPPVDPVALAVQAPGVRIAVVPPQRADLTIVVPPCSDAQVAQSDTTPPPGSNQIVIPKGSLAQTVAVPPCIEGQAQQTSGAGTVLISPGGAKTSQAQSQQQTPAQQNQLVIPANSDLRTVIIPPCLVSTSSSSSSSGSSGSSAESNTLALPASGGSKTVTAPPCTLSASSSSSSGG